MSSWKILIRILFFIKIKKRNDQWFQSQTENYLAFDLENIDQNQATSSETSSNMNSNISSEITDSLSWISKECQSNQLWMT